ncbi:MAG TPA: OB-fold domain-containing protein [Candidatus Binatia bacterium]
MRHFLATHRRVLALHGLSPEYEWVRLSGKGKVYSFVTYCRARHPSHEDKVPYNVSLVDLDEGPRLSATSSRARRIK